MAINFKEKGKDSGTVSEKGTGHFHMLFGNRNRILSTEPDIPLKIPNSTPLLPARVWGQEVLSLKSVFIGSCIVATQCYQTLNDLKLISYRV